MKYLKEYLQFSYGIENILKRDKIEEISEYLSYKFQRKINPFNILSDAINTNSYLFNYDDKRILKLEIFDEPSQIILYKYLIKHSNDLPIAKIYNTGLIDIPYRFIIKKEYKNTYLYSIMEKISIDQNLIEDLRTIHRGTTFVGKKMNIEEFQEEYTNGLITLIPKFITSPSPYSNKYIDLIEEAYRGHRLHSLVVEYINIHKKLKEHNIFWDDIHEHQFGRNHKGELVAIDLDGLYNDDYTNDKIKTHIRESSDNSDEEKRRRNSE